jgi:hypothetical protein
MSKSSVLAVIVAGMCSLPAAAQEKPAPPPTEGPPAARVTQEPERGDRVPLKVTVVLSRYQGEKRLSSLPYVFGVTAAQGGGGPRTSLRMGVDVPVVQTVFGGAKAEGASVPQSSYSYRSVGTSIDCQAAGPFSGVYQLNMTVADSSIQLQPPTKEPAPEGLRNVPSFRTLNSTFTVLMRDGQTTQHTSATDPVSGEVMRIDVTLNVVK